MKSPRSFNINERFLNRSQISETNSSNSSFGSSWISWCEDEAPHNTEKKLEKPTSDSNEDISLKEKLLHKENEKANMIQEIAAGKYKSKRAMVEAEKKLLLFTLETELLINKSRKKSATKIQNSSHTGTVNISDVKIQYSDHPSKSSYYFLCVLSCNSTLFASEILEIDSNGFVYGNINHTFLNLPVDFKIKIRIYILVIKKSSFKMPKLSCYQRKKDEENWNRESYFSLWKEIVINIAHINNSHEFILDLIQSNLCKLCIKLTGDITESKSKYEGWVDVSKNDGLFWAQRWCVLESIQLKQYCYPVQDVFEEPVDTINLKNCTGVKIPGWTRSRTLILEIRKNEKITFYYLSFDSKNAFDCWKTYLGKLVSDIQIWKQNR